MDDWVGEQVASVCTQRSELHNASHNSTTHYKHYYDKLYGGGVH